jgi:DNA-binding Xre family transcriptional regulator
MTINNTNNNNRGSIHNRGINNANLNALKGKQKDALRKLCKILEILVNKIEDEQKLPLRDLAKFLEQVSDKQLKDFLRDSLNE